MDYHIVLKTFSKFTGMHLYRIFLKKLKSHLMKKRLQHILLSVSFVKFLGTTLLLKTSRELFFKKWRTNFLIIIKRCGKVNSSFKKRNHLRKLTANLKLDCNPQKNICFNDSPSKMMKNAFYFILKALFVLKIFKLLSWLFRYVEKMTWLER